MFSSLKYKQALLIVFAAVFIFVQFFGLALSPTPALAVPVEVTNPVVVAYDVSAERKEVKMSIWSKLMDAALGSILHAATYFMRRLAYDTAIYLATGDKGQGSLIFQGEPGKYFEEIGKNAAADAIDQIGQKFGLNLCQPADLDFQVFLKIGLRSLYVDYWGGTDGPKPSCDWQSLKAATAGTYANAKGLSAERMFTNALRFEDTDFGIAAGATAKVGRNQAIAEKGAEIAQMAGQGFKAVTELVTGNVKIPAQTVKEESKLVTNKGQSEMSMGQVAGVYGSGSLQLIPMAASVFLNTFMSQGLKTLQEKLLTLWQEGGSGEDIAGLLSFESSGFQSSRQKAQAVFSSILSVNIQQLNDYPFLEEFAACPDPPLKPGLNNCVIDMELKSALDMAKHGAPLTIREAIDKGLLRGERPLISPKRVADNTSKDCYLKGYCYSNLQKLRRSRILPLGFEIAAYLADPDNPEKTWTLRQVMEGFDDCKYDKGKVVPDFTNFPYCHLIDPNWILKAPDTRCNSKVYSSNLTDETSGMRAEECVDAPARLKIRLMPGTSKEDNYGYCTREKNVWNLPGDSCDAQYNTCTTFTASKDGKMSSYLARTVDYGECNLGNVGCLAYGAEKVGDKWVTSAEAGKTMYFNDKIKKYSCSPEANGCTGFYLGVLTEDGYVNHYVDGDLIHLKKAPDYLGCYDAVPSTPQVDWPQTKPELKDIKPDVIRCSEFAGVCLPEEVNCDSYTSVKEQNPLAIPAVIGEENYCDEKCVGYDTFKQTVTNFAPSEFPLYFIPQNGQSCAYDGCDEFTNIDVQTKGGKGEELEQYTDLKYCERPNGKNESVFYSWEGSKTEGYVLKTHKLRPLTVEESEYLQKLSSELKLKDENGVLLAIADIFPHGSPAYASDNPEDLQIDYDLCNKDGYNKLINGYSSGFGGTASADCRALYDKNGKIFYRLLKDTITISQACHPLRKTISYLYTDNYIDNQDDCVNKKHGYWGDDPTDNLVGASVCRRCENGGFYENGSCIYWAISQPGEAEWCPAEAVGCREYKGNAGNNLMFVWQEDFMPGEGKNALDPAAKGWIASAGQLAIVQEAIQVGGYSLQVNANEAIYTFASSTLETNKLYTLSFWTRGEPQKLSVYFQQSDNIIGNKFTFDQAHSQDINVSVSSEWQEFKLGPTQFTGDGYSPVELVFDRGVGSGAYYLDNTRLLRVDDEYHLIKDSWKTPDGNNVPGICYNAEEIPTDPYPGEALGCKLYKEESTGQEKPIIRFEKMCREEAVGCRAVFDTFNTDEEEMTVYNAWCEPAKDGKCALIIAAGNVTKELGWCKLEPGAKGCYVDKIILPDEKLLSNYWIKKSTVVVPADTPSDTPIYLTTRSESRCSSINKGCQEFGAETHNLPDMAPDSFGFSDMAVMFLNDPAHYTGANGTLCRDDLVGCGEFKNENNLFYFKDPESTGNSFCEYKTKTTIGDVSSFGWFKKDIGLCVNDETKLCRENNDCEKGNSCGKIGAVPCYDNYLLPGGEYGIWSNNTLGKYQGMVGLCPDDKNGCREFVDPADTSDLNPDGKPYYAIYNDKLTDKEKACEGQVSLKEGCVLFNKTDEPNLTFDSKATYVESKSKHYAFVSPKSNVDSAKNDSNHILKVDRDRECAEWLACRGSIPIPYPQAENGTRYSCYALQACDDGNTLKCAHELAPEDIEGRLDYYKYIQRDVSWSGGREYTGYSLYNQYSPALLEFINIKKVDFPDAKADKTVLAYVDRENTKCVSDKIDEKNGQTCGGFGICYQNQCISPVDAQFPGKITKASEATKYLLDSECRGFPEADSPFPEKYVVDKWVHNKPFIMNPLYENAKVCQQGEDCSCNYLKEEFGQTGFSAEKRYYGLGSQNPDIKKGGICQGGAIDGEACANDKDCGVEKGGVATGVCLRQTSISQRIGWNGYCLERDLSRRINARGDEEKGAFPCSTWLPLDYVPSLFDIYYSDPAVGYVPPQGAGNPGQLYCMEMLGNSGVWIKDDTPNDGVDTQVCVQDIPFAGINYCQLFLNQWTGTEDISYIGQYWSARFGGKGTDSSIWWPELDSTKVEELLGSTFNDSGLNWKNLFGLAQTKTWELLDNLNPIHGLGTKENEHAYNYISRIDVGVGPGAEHGLNDTTDGTAWSNAYQNADSPLNKLRKEWSQLAGAFMAGEGLDGKYAAPLFPDIEKPSDYNKTWHLNGDDVGNPAFSKETSTSVNADSSVIRHSPNRAEKFLEKSMIYAVSLIIIAPSEDDGDSADASDVPALGYPLTIYLDKEYPSEGETTDSSALEMKKSGAGSCPFCKYWVMKTLNTREKYSSASVDEEGYLLQWHQIDPVLGGGEGTNGFDEYANQGSYLVNPLRSTRNPDTVAVKCNNLDGQNNHFIAMEIRFNKETGEFLGYRSRNCDQIDGGDGQEWGYATAVVFTLRPMCVEAVKVYDGEQKTTNKAYTQNIWAESGYVDIYSNDIKLEYGLPASPFGSAQFGVGDLTDKISNPWFRIYPDPQEGELHAGIQRQCINKFSADTIVFDGVCSQTGNFRDELLGYHPDANKSQEKNFYSADNSKYFFFNSLFAKAFDVYSRVNYSSDDNYVLKDMWASSTPATSDLFKKKTDLTTGDISYKNGRPPRIYPVKKCEGSFCAVDAKNPNNFSVNGVGGTTSSDKLYGKRSMPVTMSFFAWADSNQMPLRRVLVQWNDIANTEAGDTSGYYKNFKPYCDGETDKECISIAGKTQTYDTLPVTGWIGKTAEEWPDEKTDPVSCDTTQKCKDKFTYMYDLGYYAAQFNLDYDFDALVCKDTQCQLETKIPAKTWIVEAGDLDEEGNTQWQSSNCFSEKICAVSPIYNRFNTSQNFSVNGYIHEFLRAGYKNFDKNTINSDDFVCEGSGYDKWCSWEYEKAKSTYKKINGWIKDGGDRDLDMSKGKGPVSCGMSIPNDCKNKFDKMIELSYCGTNDEGECDYPPTDQIVCVNQICSTQTVTGVEYTQNDLFGLTCKDTNECPTDHICQSVNKQFGNQSRTTCVNTPALRVFNYTCDANKYVGVSDPPDYVWKVADIGGVAFQSAYPTINGSSWHGLLLKKGHKDPDLVCVFQPRAQVLDNWGWCSGSCDDVKSGEIGGVEKGCYNGDSTKENCNNPQKDKERFVPFSNIIVVAP